MSNSINSFSSSAEFEEVHNTPSHESVFSLSDTLNDNSLESSIFSGIISSVSQDQSLDSIEPSRVSEIPNSTQIVGLANDVVISKLENVPSHIVSNVTKNLKKFSPQGSDSGIPGNMILAERGNGKTPGKIKLPLDAPLLSQTTGLNLTLWAKVGEEYEKFEVEFVTPEKWQISQFALINVLVTIEKQKQAKLEKQDSQPASERSGDDEMRHDRADNRAADAKAKHRRYQEDLQEEIVLQSKTQRRVVEAEKRAQEDSDLEKNVQQKLDAAAEKRHLKNQKKIENEEIQKHPAPNSIPKKP